MVFVVHRDRYSERVQHNSERKEFLEHNQKVHDELSSKSVFGNDVNEDEDDN